MDDKIISGTFIGQLYKIILEKDPDDEEMQYWIKQWKSQSYLITMDDLIKQFLEKAVPKFKLKTFDILLCKNIIAREVSKIVTTLSSICPKILYYNGHISLEYDELSVLEYLGFEWVSLGYYMHNNFTSIRNSIYLNKNKNIVPSTAIEKISSCHKPTELKKLTQEMVEPFDIIIAVHFPDFIINNWDVLKNKRVIWRTIGQSVSFLEKLMKPYREAGMEIVRYSPKECFIPNYIGQDCFIRFGKDSSELCGWTGLKANVITMCNAIEQRPIHCHYETCMAAMKGFDFRIYGDKNNPAYGGHISSWKEMIEIIKESRCYLYVGTQPASYTLNFIEALMIGIPIVAMSAKMWETLSVSKNLYEIEDIIIHGKNGFICNNIEELRTCIKLLIDDYELAKRISMEGRKTALKYFDQNDTMLNWAHYLLTPHVGVKSLQ